MHYLFSQFDWEGGGGGGVWDEGNGYLVHIRPK